METLPIAISIGALIVSVISLFWNFLLEQKRKKANLQVWQQNIFYPGEDDDTKINLIIRNMSHRPTAILDVYTKDSNGGVLINLRAKEKSALPIKISPWEVAVFSFFVDSKERQKIDHICVRDLDDSEIIVKRAPGKRWHK